MNLLLRCAFLLSLALLLGGNALFTFLATPAVFRAFERHLAGEVVAAMMPGYFTWNLVLWILAAALNLAEPTPGKRARDLALLGVGLAAALAVMVWLYPTILEVRAQVASFAAEAPITAARAHFRRLHGVSLALNLVQLLAAAVLLFRFACRGRSSKWPGGNPDAR